MSLSQCHVCQNYASEGCTIHPDYYKVYRILAESLSEEATMVVADLIEPCEDWDEAVEVDFRVSLRTWRCLTELPLSPSQQITLEPLLKVAQRVLRGSDSPEQDLEPSMEPASHDEVMAEETAVVVDRADAASTATPEELLQKEIPDDVGSPVLDSAEGDASQDELMSLFSAEGAPVGDAVTDAPHPEPVAQAADHGQVTSEEESPQSEVEAEDAEDKFKDEFDLEMEQYLSDRPLNPNAGHMLRTQPPQAAPVLSGSSLVGAADNYSQPEPLNSSDRPASVDAKSAAAHNRGSGRMKKPLGNPDVFFTL